MQTLEPNRIDLVSIEFQHYKALRNFRLDLDRMNIFVGRNNSGKSTIIGALRLLAAAIRKAQSTRPKVIHTDKRGTYGWELHKDVALVSFENVHTDYADTDTFVLFSFSNQSTIKLYFPAGNECFVIAHSEDLRIRTATEFSEAFPFKMSVVPVLGPLEHQEPLVSLETVQRNLETHRASRNFRNFWYYNQRGFDHYAALVNSTWPSMVISRPRLQQNEKPELYMFVSENRVPRELYWCGFGFQIWCQLLTQISRNRDVDLLVIDEPEIYLHPDLQRQILGILKDCGPSIAIATHSTEIITEAEPEELIAIDKASERAYRLHNTSAVQDVIFEIGSLRNISIVHAAQCERVIYVENKADFDLIKKFAVKLGYSRLADSRFITPVTSGGYGSWKEIKNLHRRLIELYGQAPQVMALYDRDYRCDEETDHIINELHKELRLVWVLGAKEIENYLLDPAVLNRVVLSQIRLNNRASRQTNAVDSVKVLSSITEMLKHDCLGQYSARRKEYLRTPNKDDSENITAVSKWLDEHWHPLEERMKIVPGKRVLKQYRAFVSDTYKISFSDGLIAETFEANEVPTEIKEIIRQINES